MQLNKPMRHLSRLLLVVMLLLGVGGVQAAPQKKKADVYFGRIEKVDVASRLVHVDVYNVNRSAKIKGKFTFLVAPDAAISTEQANRKTMRNMTLHNVAESSWIWVVSYDGQTTKELTASALTSYRGTLIATQGNSISLKLDQRSIGSRLYKIADSEEPRSFLLPERILYQYKGKPADVSLVAPGAYLRVTTLEKGGVVLVTILDKEK